MTVQPRYWAVLPASGIGARVGGQRPKQYLELLGKTVIEHSLERLLAHSLITGAVVALAAQDDYGHALLNRLSSRDKPLHIVTGGAERCQSVRNALQHLHTFAAPADWVLVHDAARPCLRQTDIDSLVASLGEHEVGGLLGIPVSDTVKRVGPGGAVLETLNREELWRAQTPQMFRLGLLSKALADAIDSGLNVTDEAAAMALAGLTPLMVEGHADNIKITHPPDLALARFYLEQQLEQQGMNS